jgi:hypothetical protein
MTVEGIMQMDKLLLAACAALTATPVLAGIFTVPEPGTFELLALGGIAAAVVAIRNRRRK